MVYLTRLISLVSLWRSVPSFPRKIGETDFLAAQKFLMALFQAPTFASLTTGEDIWLPKLGFLLVQRLPVSEAIFLSQAGRSFSLGTA